MVKSKKLNCKIYIGTSGWSYDWKNFYPNDISKKDWLKFYASQFNSVEINYSFYRLPSMNTYKRWFKETPDDFVFALKLSRYITHTKRLSGIKSALKKFIKSATKIENKCGPVLVQLPENFEVDCIKLKKFLETTKIISEELNIYVKYAFEFRHKSWLSDSNVFKILESYNAAIVFSHSSEIPYIESERLTSDFVYLRLHGPKQLYASSYTDKQLKIWVKKINLWKKQSKFIYIYFNNDVYGYAPSNAKTLIKFLKN